MSDDEIEKIKTNISESSLEICTSCGYCDVCPQGIPIPKYMQIYNDKVLFNVSEKAFKDKLEFHYNWGLLVEDLPRAKECTACGKCEKLCTQHLPIIKRLKEFAKLREK